MKVLFYHAHEMQAALCIGRVKTVRYTCRGDWMWALVYHPAKKWHMGSASLHEGGALSCGFPTPPRRRASSAASQGGRKGRNAGVWLPGLAGCTLIVLVYLNFLGNIRGRVGLSICWPGIDSCWYKNYIHDGFICRSDCSIFVQIYGWFYSHCILTEDTYRKPSSIRN